MLTYIKTTAGLTNVQCPPTLTNKTVVSSGTNIFKPRPEPYALRHALSQNNHPSPPSTQENTADPPPPPPKHCVPPLTGSCFVLRGVYGCTTPDQPSASTCNISNVGTGPCQNTKNGFYIISTRNTRRDVYQTVGGCGSLGFDIVCGLWHTSTWYIHTRYAILARKVCHSVNTGDDIIAGTWYAINPQGSTRNVIRSAYPG